jgi:uncharacterized protein
MDNKIHTNSLIHESSPYLLQHAHNPVDWHPWKKEVLEKAQQEDKLLLVSIGYAACHWCHVMERECFEDEEVAQVMNSKYICIKIDREERPDVDHFFMTAIQITGSQGGWPLNCVALPDGRPIWGGTYFPKENWMHALNELNRLYHDQREDTVRHAENLADGIRQASLPVKGEESPATLTMIENAVKKWKHHFDNKHGGRNGKPKFPMPVNIDFLLHYAHNAKDIDVRQYVELTLTKMAMGGIYDQAGGGFARYSVDELWKVPHFEKMVYDNGQLLSVYSKAFQMTHNELFREVIYETVEYLQREMLHPSGAFYSSLDADSENVEGMFYTWTIRELKVLLNEDFRLFADYYNINATGHWEDGRYILLRDKSDEEFADQQGIDLAEIKNRIARWKALLMKHRESRIRPALDDKTLTSWNALVIQGLCDATKAFGDERFKNLALKNGLFLKDNLFTPEGGLYHTWKNGKATIPGFLEDYALVIQAYISLYEISGDESWILLAQQLTQYAIKYFYDTDQDFFFFNEKNNNETITNHYQKEDNVIASSNSVMAINLLYLSRLFSNMKWEKIAGKMARKISSSFSAYPYAYANWGRLLLMLISGTREVAIIGNNAPDLMAEMQKNYYPDVIWASAIKETSVPLLLNRYAEGKTLIYVCSNGSCRMPVETADEALNFLI